MASGRVPNTLSTFSVVIGISLSSRVVGHREQVADRTRQPQMSFGPTQVLSTDGVHALDELPQRSHPQIRVVEVAGEAVPDHEAGTCAGDEFGISTAGCWLNASGS